MIRPMPRPPPRQHKHERQYTPSTHPVSPTRRIWNDDYDGQMIVVDLMGLKFPDIRLTGEEKPRKNLTQETCPDRGRTRARCVTSAHASTYSTAVDLYANIRKRKEWLTRTREEYVGNAPISPLSIPFSSVHGSTPNFTKLQYENSSITTEFPNKK